MVGSSAAAVDTTEEEEQQKYRAQCAGSWFFIKILT